MSTVVYWFSGSGNSFHVAKALQEGMEDVELVPVAEAVNADVQLSPKMGLVFPVYVWGPEKAVQYGGKTLEQVRYHHRETSLKELLLRED